MASEITITSKITATKNGVTVVNATTSKTQTMESTAANMIHGTQDVGFAASEKLADGDVATEFGGFEYFVLLRNLDDTNSCKVSVRTAAATYQQVGLMRPGEFWGPVRMQVALETADFEGELYLQFDTADGQVEYLLVEAGDPAA